MGDLLYVSSVRDTGDTGAGDDSDLRMLLANAPLVEEGGGSFRPFVQKAGSGRLATPGIVPQAASVDLGSGSWAAAAFLSHEALGFPAALDQSARDGRNMLWDNDQYLNLPLEQIVTGSVTGVMNPVAHFGHGVRDVSHGPNQHGEVELLSLSYVGGDDRASLLVRQTSEGGSPERLGMLANTSGSERLYPHTAGRFVLICGGPSPRLFDLQERTLTQLPIHGDYAWWPGSSAIVGCAVVDDVPVLQRYDLATGKHEPLGPVESGPEGLEPYRWFPHELTIAPSGRVACMSGLGPSAEHQAEHGSQPRVHELDLEYRTLEPLETPFLPGSERFERVHRRPAYLGYATAEPFELFEGFAVEAVPASVRDPDYELVWQDANDLVVKALRALVQRSDSTSAPAIGKFVPAALWAIRSHNPSQLAEIADWVMRSTTHARITSAGGGSDAVREQFWDDVRAAVDGYV